MRNPLPIAAAICLLCLARPSHACGGGFGQNVTIDPAQTLVVVHRAGQESYVFQPKFCGAANEFGLLLPVPAALTKDPALLDAALYTQLAEITAPRVETVDVCKQGGLMGASKGATAAGDRAVSEGGSGVDVIDQGTVGIFSWTLLKADTAQVFTDWLDANQFPYPASATAAFEHYVQAGWYFVAFQVSSGTAAPPSGYRICGSFGPIRLDFPSTAAVIPARMATASDRTSSFLWRVFTVSSHQYALPIDSQAEGELRFAGQLTQSDLTGHPAVAGVALASEWLTELDLTFYAGALTNDLVLEPASSDQAYRRTVYVEREVSCGVFGCSVTTPPIGRGWLALVLTLAAGLLVLTTVKRNARVQR